MAEGRRTNQLRRAQESGVKLIYDSHDYDSGPRIKAYHILTPEALQAISRLNCPNWAKGASPPPEDGFEAAAYTDVICTTVLSNAKNYMSGNNFYITLNGKPWLLTAAADDTIYNFQQQAYVDPSDTAEIGSTYGQHINDLEYYII